jgi:Na+-transporting NADH:ubiquinone oxidoreductase subunit NqrB
VDLLRRISPRYLVVFLVTLILVLGELRYSILGGYDRLAVALFCSICTELILSRIYRGSYANIASAYVSGISLSLLTKPQASILWPFALGAFLAISSKYVLTYHNRHLWNPTNFAIAAMVILAPTQVAILSHQWGNDLAINAVIWAFGLVIAGRAGVLHITLGYVASFVPLAILRNALVGGPLLAEVAPITGPMYQLFVFFMITDPRTTVSSRRGRLLVAFLIALVEAVIRLAGDMQVAVVAPLYRSPPIYALFLVGPVAMWIDLRRRAMADGGQGKRLAGTSNSAASHGRELPAVNGLAEN